MEVAIEKDVPLVRRRGFGRKPKWPVNALEVNESFVLPSDKADSVRTICQRAKRETGKMFAVRFDYDYSDQHGGKFHRCWRLS